jgi:hypothetical protein
MIGARAVPVAVVAFVMAPLGCRWWEGQPPASPPVAALQARIEAKRSVSFRSFDGKAWAMDSDTEMTLFRDQTAHLFEHGFRDRQYNGTYSLDRGGRLTATFEGRERRWPAMHLREEGGRFRLYPEDADAGFSLRDRGAAGMPRGGRFWPFAILDGEDEKQVLRRIDR